MKKKYVKPQIAVLKVPELCSGITRGSVVNSDTEKTEDYFDVREDNGENSDGTSYGWDWGGD